jgi:hypothetical protein
MKVSDKQRKDWTENPVTIALRNLCKIEFNGIVMARPSDNLIRGEPQLTQENLIEFIDLLEGDWEDLELDDEE